MNKKGFLPMIILIGVFSILGGITSGVRAMGKGPEAPLITKEQLLSIMGKPEVVILDVREEEAWEESKQKIRGAVRQDPENDIPGWYDPYPKEKTLVFYCS